MSLICSPRQVQTTTSNLPSGSVPTVMNRSSDFENGSRTVTASSSSRTPAASGKARPCFSRFRRAFSGSHSTPHQAAALCDIQDHYGLLAFVEAVDDPERAYPQRAVTA